MELLSPESFSSSHGFAVSKGFLILLLHKQASLKKFMDYIQTSAVDKMVKFMDKGLDPNFQDSDTGGKENACPSPTASPHVPVNMS